MLEPLPILEESAEKSNLAPLIRGIAEYLFTCWRFHLQLVMPPIPLNSFRILNKKFGWQKSYEEIHQDDMDDVDLFKSEIKKSEERFFSTDADTWGPWEGSSEAILLFWYRYFNLVMRLHVKTAYIRIGTQNRGISVDLYNQHLEGSLSLISSLESLTLTSSTGHLTFYCFHLAEQRNEIGNKEFFQYIFEKHYVSLVEKAHSTLKEQQTFFSDKNVDPDRLIVNLRERWSILYNEIIK